MAERRAAAERQAARLHKTGQELRPVQISGRTIAHTFWGKAWCQNLESYSDYANRLPRGRTYARNGSILDLQIGVGSVTALVSGSRLYNVTLRIDPLPSERWGAIRGACSGQIDSLVELLQGALSKGVMERVTLRGSGLFPTPEELHLSCSCPDWAVMCKHVAATLYAVGARLDDEPEMLFSLRGVDPVEMFEQAFDGVAGLRQAHGRRLEVDDLSSIFGVDIDFEALVPEPGALDPGRIDEAWRRAEEAGEWTVVLYGGLTLSGADGRSCHSQVAVAVTDEDDTRLCGVIGHQSYEGADEALAAGSDRWGDLSVEVRERADPDRMLIHVMDAEQGARAVWPRLLAQLDDFVIGLPIKCKDLTWLPEDEVTCVLERPLAESRLGTLLVRGGFATQGPGELDLTVVEVTEIDPPRGRAPLHWRLLSTLSACSEGELAKIVDTYRKRSMLTEFFEGLR